MKKKVSKIDLKAVLSVLTKNELLDLADGIPAKVTTKMNKAQIIEALIVELPLTFARRFNYTDVERYLIYSDIVKKGGEMKHDDYPMWHDLEYLQNEMYIFNYEIDMEIRLVLPLELVKAFEDLDNEINYAIAIRNTEKVELVIGMVRNYGMINIADAMAIAEVRLGKIFTHTEFYYVLKRAEAFYEIYSLSSDGMLASHLVLEEEFLQDVLEDCEDLQYYPFTKEELLKSGRSHKAYPEDLFEPLEKVLFHYCKVSDSIVYQVIATVLILIQAGAQTKEIVNYLKGELELLDKFALGRLTKIIDAIVPETPLWGLKGYSLNKYNDGDLIVVPEKEPITETSNLMAIDFQSKKRVGRNDLCPCGSGKKYKHCCGK